MKISQPGRNTLKLVKSAATEASSRTRLIASPGEPGKACAPGWSSTPASMLYRNKEHTINWCRARPSCSVVLVSVRAQAVTISMVSHKPGPQPEATWLVRLLKNARIIGPGASSSRKMAVASRQLSV